MPAVPECLHTFNETDAGVHLSIDLDLILLQMDLILLQISLASICSIAEGGSALVEEPELYRPVVLWIERIEKMNFKTGLIATVILLGSSAAIAQSGTASGRGSTTGDPAASSANPRAAPTTTTGSNPSGSGTSSSGGRDDNGDQGRDKMPESNLGVRPYDQQKKPSK